MLKSAGTYQRLTCCQLLKFVHIIKDGCIQKIHRRCYADDKKKTKKTANELKLQQGMDNFKTKPEEFKLEKSLIYI